MTPERDLDAVRAGLEAWWRARHPDARDVTVAPPTRPSAGLSSDTLLVDVAWRGGAAALVARLPPIGDALFPDYDLTVQARVQESLAASGLPVARPLALEADARWVGAPFLLMPRVPGRGVANSPPFVAAGWIHDATPGEQTSIAHAFFDAVADVHRFDWRAHGLGFLARPGDGRLASEVAWWSAYLAWATDGAPPAPLADALAWCRAHRPDPEPPASLLWGDVQLSNAVFDDAGHPAAILDWEMASIGPAELDLGWFFALHRTTVHSHGGDLPGFPDRAAIVARHERRLGRRLLDLRWFEVFGLLRACALFGRVLRLLAARGVDAGWMAEQNPMQGLLGRLIDGSLE